VSFPLSPEVTTQWLVQCENLRKRKQRRNREKVIVCSPTLFFLFLIHFSANLFLRSSGILSAYLSIAFATSHEAISFSLKRRAHTSAGRLS